VLNMCFLIGICGFIAYQTHRVNSLDTDALIERGFDSALRSPRLRALSQNLTSTLIALFNPLPIDAPQLLNYVLHSNISSVLNSLAPLVESWSYALNDTFFAEKLADPFWSVAEVMRILGDVEWLSPTPAYQPQSIWGVLAVSLLGNTNFPINIGQQSQLAAALIQVCTALQNADWTFQGLHGQKRDLTGPICMVTTKIMSIAENLQKQHGQKVLPRATTVCSQCQYKYYSLGCPDCILGGCTWCASTNKCTSAYDTTCAQPSQSCNCYEWPDCNSCIQDPSKTCYWCLYQYGNYCQSGSSSQCAQRCSMHQNSTTATITQG